MKGLCTNHRIKFVGCRPRGSNPPHSAREAQAIVMECRSYPRLEIRTGVTRNKFVIISIILSSIIIVDHTKQGPVSMICQSVLSVVEPKRGTDLHETLSENTV